MSFSAISWAIKQDTGNTTSKIVLIVIANYCNENIAYPSQEHIATICHCSRRSVNSAVKKLVQRGLIKIKKQSNGLKVWNSYIIQCADTSHNTNISKTKKYTFARKKRNKNFIAG